MFCETREISWTSKRLQASQVLPCMKKVIVFVTCWPHCSSYRIENLMLNNHQNVYFSTVYVVILDFERNSQAKEMNLTPSITDCKQFSTSNLSTH